MKKICVLIAIIFVVTVSFGQKYQSYGSKIEAQGANKVEVLLKTTAISKSVVKVEGEVESVCQAAGCWMKVKLADGKTMRVTFKDYSFFVPKDLAGKKIIFEGIPEISTTSVADLQHYAQDAGKNKEEIAKIKEPKTELTFVADGVLVPGN